MPRKASHSGVTLTAGFINLSKVIVKYTHKTDRDGQESAASISKANEQWNWQSVANRSSSTHKRIPIYSSNAASFALERSLISSTVINITFDQSVIKVGTMINIIFFVSFFLIYFFFFFSLFLLFFFLCSLTR